MVGKIIEFLKRFEKESEECKIQAEINKERKLLKLEQERDELMRARELKNEFRGLMTYSIKDAIKGE